MMWGPGPARARSSCADRPGPGPRGPARPLPGRKKYVQARPGPQNIASPVIETSYIKW